jgi:23S rRNA (pseudouridine1915-N3)-methyltransferase
MARVEVVEVRDERGTDPGAARTREGERILKSAGGGDFVLLDEGGREMSSRELAAFAGERDSLTFVVGGAWGVSEEVRRAAGSRLSLSRMTLTHEMARLVLLEQLYRALMIQTGREGYHH